MAVFGKVYGVSRELVASTAGVEELDALVLREMSLPAADGRPRIIVSTPKFETGLSLAGVGKSVVLESSYGLAMGL